MDIDLTKPPRFSFASSRFRSPSFLQLLGLGAACRVNLSGQSGGAFGDVNQVNKD